MVQETGIFGIAPAAKIRLLQHWWQFKTVSHITRQLVSLLDHVENFQPDGWDARNL
jgi:hypothetical protein